MERGLYAAATGMLAQQSMQDVLAQNIANASTVGYKQDTPTFRTIQSMTLQRLADGHGRGPTIGELGTGVKSDKVYIDWQTGPLTSTGNPLDASLGNGQFFAVQTPQGERYTRAGALLTDGGGNLMTAGGLRVLNSNGQPIVAPKTGKISLDSTGSLLADEAVVAKLKIVQIDTAQIQKSGDNLFQAPPAAVRLAPGEVVAVLGPSGVGKSTLFRCITGLLRADAGMLHLDGADIAALRAVDRREIAVVFQQYNLVRRLTALDNVLAGRLGHVAQWRGILRRFERADMLKALECLERVGVLDQAMQRADTLSGGQQQRVAIARALAQKARLIVADEPVASLDPGSAAGVLQLLREIARTEGVAVLCSLHQTGYARTFADRILGMSDGQVIVDAPAGELDEAAIAALYAPARVQSSADEGSSLTNPPLTAILDGDHDATFTRAPRQT